LAVPLSGETPQGVITLSRLAGAAPFTDDDVELAELLAHQVGMAWRLGRDQQEHHHITFLQDRDRVNRLRNDEVLQRLFALGVALQSLPRQDWDDEQRRTLDRITGEFDDLTRHIRPIVVTRNQNATTLTALTAMIEAELAPLVASLGFRPRLEVQQGEAEVPTTLVPVVVSVVYDLTRAAATNPQISALTCRLGVEDDWLLVDATEQGSNSTAEWSYPLRHELESRADEFDGLCTVTSAGPDHRHITWRIPM
jgi:two-component system sensor histidine kinase DevS